MNIRKVTRPVRQKLRKRTKIAILNATFFLNRRAIRACTRIAVTGSSGKSSTVSMIGTILDDHSNVFVSAFQNTFPRILERLGNLKPEHDFAVFEVGAGAEHAVEAMAKKIVPSIGVITTIKLEHFGRFRTVEAIAEEKAHLVAAVPPDGVVILNADSPLSMAAASSTRARIKTFGTSDDADYRIVSSQLHGMTLQTVIAAHGDTYKIETQTPSTVISGSVAAAFAVANECGVAPEKAATSLSKYKGIYDRFQVIPIDGGVTFISDANKAPAHSLEQTFEAFAQIQAKRKIIIVGHISDYQGSSDSMYRKAYESARNSADYVVFIGPKNHKIRPCQQDTDEGRYRSFDEIIDLREHLRSFLCEGDVVLLKSSRSSHLIRLALDYTETVRCWEHNCRVKSSCAQCGKIAIPFDQHRNVPKKKRKWFRREQAVH